MSTRLGKATTSKKEKITKISDFEETCMWMSYRYAIGRHTIASTMHANDIATHFFYRLSNDRKEFTAFDIAREIDNDLRWQFNLFIEYPNLNVNYYPYEILMKFIKKYNIKDLDEFNKFDRIDYDCSTEEFKVKYVSSYIDAYHSSPDGSEQKEIYDKKRNYNTMDLDDLLHWQMLAACFDVKHLKVVKTLYEGKEEEHICFKSYSKQYGRATEISQYNGEPYEINDIHNVWWEERWIPIDRYLAGSEGVYIASEYITDIRDITESEIKKFEAYD
jgi:hypothetical protein